MTCIPFDIFDSFLSYLLPLCLYALLWELQGPKINKPSKCFLMFNHLFGVIMFYKAALSCSPSAYYLAGAGLGIWLMGKLGQCMGRCMGAWLM